MRKHLQLYSKRIFKFNLTKIRSVFNINLRFIRCVVKLNLLKMRQDYKLWRNSLTPYMNNRAYLYVLLSICAVAMLAIHSIHGAAIKPEVRPGNRNPKNPYGEEGKQRLPHAIVIGVRKGGTRAILSYLKRHPDIRTAKSEVHFFGKWKNYRQGFEWYRHLMPYSRENQITIEKTPSYFHTESAPENIYHMNSSVKLILVVRDPVKRAVSDFIQSQGKHSFMMPLMGIRKFENVADPNSWFNGGFIARSTYIEIIKRWLKYFPKEQILILDGDQLVKDPITEMRRTETFLGVKHYLDSNMFVLNEDKKFYCIKDNPESEPHCLSKSKGRPHPEIDPKVKQKLQEYFKPYNEQLFELVGRRFDWEGV